MQTILVLIFTFSIFLEEWMDLETVHYFSFVQL